MRISDWSSDVCSSDLEDRAQMAGIRQQSGFGSPLLGGVAQDLAEPAELAILFVQRSDRYMRQAFGTILADPPVLFLEFAQFACALKIYPWLPCLHCIDGIENGPLQNGRASVRERVWPYV